MSYRNSWKFRDLRIIDMLLCVNND